MNKFSVEYMELPKGFDETKPTLFKMHFGSSYYIHKGKVLKQSVDRLLDDVFRGMRGFKYDKAYSEVVKYCDTYKAFYKVVVEVLLNAEPDKILKKEDQLYKQMKNDTLSLNRIDLGPYKPEWMIKQSLQKRCEDCITNGVINNKKSKFKFCPNCGRLNK